MWSQRAAALPAAAAIIIALAAASTRQPESKATRMRLDAALGGQTVRALLPSEVKSPATLAPGDRGATFYWLEGSAARVTARFADAVAVAERGADGAVRTRLLDPAENELATFRVRLGGPAGDLLEYQQTGKSPFFAVKDAAVHTTLDWTARQTYRLWKEAPNAESTPMQWQDGFMRPTNASKRSADDDTVEMRAEWADGLSAVVTKTSGVRRHIASGASIVGHTIVSRLHRDGVLLGTVEWYPEEQTAAWSLPGISEGWIDGERLKRVGGWPFTPDMAWAAVQGVAFQRFHQQIAAKRFVAEHRAGPLERLLGFVSPVVSADEPGCDGLHWLDGTVLRFCCDVHDDCYARNGCSAWSWWLLWSSWTCDYCNMSVIYCFTTGGTYPPYRRSPY